MKLHKSVFCLVMVSFLAAIPFSCKKTGAKISSSAIYYWKTNYSVDSTENNFLHKHKLEKQYIRFFDVGLEKGSKQSKPIHPISFQQKPSGAIVPTIFILNEVFLSKTNLTDLARNILDKIMAMAISQNINIKEIQIDCDWTLMSKLKYFAFLEKLKSLSAYRLSATIRLHQIKFSKKSGVPPVDYGVLMVYNTGNWRTYSKSNSLFDAKDILPYLDNLHSYPLHLQIALPIFKQNLLYRNGRFKQFLNNVKTESNQDFVFQKDSTLTGTSIRAADMLKIEKPSFKELEYIKSEILRNLNQFSTEIILFHLDTNHLNNYSHEEFTKLLE